MSNDTRCRVCRTIANQQTRRVRDKLTLCKRHWRDLQLLLDNVALGLQQDLWKPNISRIEEYRTLVYVVRQAR